MEQKTRIYLDNIGDLDLSQNEVIPLNFSIADIKDISKKNGGYTKRFRIPATKTNNEILGHLYDINIDEATFNIHRKVECSIYIDDLPVMEGYFRLESITKMNEYTSDGDGYFYYNCVVFDDVTNFFDDLENKLLEDLDFSQYNHIFSYENIFATSAHTAADVYTYPMLYNDATDYYTTKDFQPAIYMKAYLDKIFDSIEYEYVFENAPEEFDKLIIPWNGGKPVVTTENLVNKTFAVGMSGASSNLEIINDIPISNSTDNIIQKLPFNDESSDDDYGDLNNLFNTNTNTYTSNRNFTQDFNIKFNVDIIVSASTSVTASTTSFGAPSTAPYVELIQTTLVPILGGALTIPYDITYRNWFIKELQNQHTTVGEYKLILPEEIAAGETTLASVGVDITFKSIDTLIDDEFYVNYGTQNFNDVTNWIDASGNSQDVNIVSRIALNTDDDEVTVFKNMPQVTEFSDGDLVPMNSFIPKEVEQKDFVSSFFKMFNIYPDFDDNQRNKIIFRTRDEFLGGTEFVDWTDKIDLEQPHEIKFTSELQNRDLILRHKEDSDEFNKKYQERIKEVYGRKKYIFDDDFLRGEKVIETIFSPTPTIKNGFLLSVPSIPTREPKNNLRVLYKPDEWLDPVGNGFWNYRYVKLDGTPVILTGITSYPWAGEFDNPRTPSKSINFGPPEFTFYNDYVDLTDNDLANRYYTNQVNELYNGKMLIAHFDLTPLDIHNLDFRKKVFIKDTYYRINRVIDYDVSKNRLTKVELIKEEDGIDFNSSNKNGQGTLDPDIRPTDGEVNELLTSSLSDGTKPSGYYPNNKLLSRNTLVWGNSNYVGDTKTSGIISGNGNILERETRAIIFGDDNQIGVNNGLLIGDSNKISGTSKSIIIGDNNTSSDGGENIFVFGVSSQDLEANTVYTNNINISSGSIIDFGNGAEISSSGSTIQFGSGTGQTADFCNSTLIVNSLSGCSGTINIDFTNLNIKGGMLLSGSTDLYDIFIRESEKSDFYKTTGGTINGDVTITGSTNVQNDITFSNDSGLQFSEGPWRFKQLNIGAWDMDATSSVSISHGLSSTEWKTVRDVKCTIRNDADTVYYELIAGVDGSTAYGSYNGINSSNINFSRATGGAWDNVNFDSAGAYNRGWVTFWYIPD